MVFKKIIDSNGCILQSKNDMTEKMLNYKIKSFESLKVSKTRPFLSDQARNIQLKTSPFQKLTNNQTYNSMHFRLYQTPDFFIAQSKCPAKFFFAWRCARKAIKQLQFCSHKLEFCAGCGKFCADVRLCVCRF